jgi:hypothetical protein
MTGNKNPIAHIVARFGGQTAFARAIGSTQSTVWEWIANGRVPSGRIVAIIEAAQHHNPPIVLDFRDFFVAPARSAKEPEAV